MRSSNTFQNDQANHYLLNMTKDNGVSSLASQFMDMFDVSKLETSLLRKREFQSHDNLYQKELQKKIKTSMTNADLTRPPLLQMPGFNPMLYNLNCQVNPLLAAALGQDQSFGLKAEIERVSQLQNLALLKQQKEALLALKPLSFPTIGNLQPQSLVSNKDKLCVKEEYVPQELPTTQGSPSSYPYKSTESDNHSLSEKLSSLNTEPQMPALEVGEPALIDFTRQFPNWDLVTIFSYIKSGKSREVFEKEKQFKAERKMRKQKLRMANKEKAASSIQQKKVIKGKRMARKTQEVDSPY